MVGCASICDSSFFKYLIPQILENLVEGWSQFDAQSEGFRAEHMDVAVVYPSSVQVCNTPDTGES